MSRRGRPRLSEDQRKKTSNVTVDQEIIALLHEASSRLEGKFGFRPTHSQTLRWLLKEGGVVNKIKEEGDAEASAGDSVLRSLAGIQE